MSCTCGIELMQVFHFLPMLYCQYMHTKQAEKLLDRAKKILSRIP